MTGKHKSVVVETAEMILVLVLFATIIFLGVKVYESNFATNDSLSKSEHSITSQPETNSFSFAALGDIGSTDNSKLVLSSLSQAQTAFTIALGDLGYGGVNTETEWCSLVKSYMGENYPFQLLVGNNDNKRPGVGSDIEKYRGCLPNRIDSLVGDYGIEYYFDHGSNNLARFIMISPDIDTYGYDYTKGSEHYQWVSDVIDDAKSNNFKWVIVGMHENCLTPGTKQCEIGEELLNLLIEKDVDLVLQGHEHGYFRSKQIDQSDGCTLVLANTYSEECVTNQNGQFVKGKGTVFVISGAGGHSLRDVNLGDAEIDYFEAVNGANVGQSFGYSLFTVRNNVIEGNFVPASGEFTDSFNISE